MSEIEFSDSRRKSRAIVVLIAKIYNAEAGNSSRSATSHELIRGSLDQMGTITGLTDLNFGITSPAFALT